MQQKRNEDQALTCDLCSNGRRQIDRIKEIVRGADEKEEDLGGRAG